MGCALLLTGCWSHVEDYCAGCTIIDYKITAVPSIGAAIDTEVVLVHGAFGFGAEWRPILAFIKESPRFGVIAWSWPGPFRNPPREARALAAELQALLDRLPPSVEELIVLSHSAAGLISNLAIRQLRVPTGRHVTVALLDPVFWPPLVKRNLYGALPAGVSATVYYARNPPRNEKLAPPNGADATDLPKQYIGPVGHDPMVAKVALPLLEARRAAQK